MWPTQGKSAPSADSYKKGIDIAGTQGQTVVAAAAGKVTYAGHGIRGYGNMVIIKHTPQLLSVYAHNATITVKEGQMVTRGQQIATMGNSDTNKVKLYFEIRRNGKPVNVMALLPAPTAASGTNPIKNQESTWPNWKTSCAGRRPAPPSSSAHRCCR
jgi:lipoprotein NlpD